MRFYEEHLGATLDAQNKRYTQHSDYGKVMTMQDYHKKHMPKEMIIQLGNKDSQPDNPKHIIDMTNKAINELRKAGFDVISADIHYDEATPHAHIRFVGLSNGKVDFKNCARAHGIKTELEETCDKLGIAVPKEKSQESYDQRLLDALPNNFTHKVDKRTGETVTRYNYRSDTEMKIITNDMIRDTLEEYASQYYEIDTIRTKRKYKPIEQFKREKDIENEQKAFDAQEQQQNARLQEIRDGKATSYDDFISEANIELANQFQEQYVDNCKTANVLIRNEIEKEFQQKEDALEAQKKVVADKAEENEATANSLNALWDKAISPDTQKDNYMKNIKFPDGTTAYDRYMQFVQHQKQKVRQSFSHLSDITESAKRNEHENEY